MDGCGDMQGAGLLVRSFGWGFCSGYGVRTLGYDGEVGSGSVKPQETSILYSRRSV